MAVVLVSYAIAYLTGILMDTVTVANVYGGLGLLCYGLTLLPGNGKSITTLPPFSPYAKPIRKSLAKLGKYRRQLGVAAFGFGFNHGVLILHSQASTWHSDISYLGIGLHYWHGLTLMTIMSILAFTSNNWSLKVLKKQWRLLHKLTYIIAFLLPWHIASAMKLHWSPITPLCLGGCSCILFLIGQRYLRPLLIEYWIVIFELKQPEAHQSRQQ
ncbi:MAG: ferric reductase-like transmembrane domain-containing protein [Cyanobacteria bacterium P01_F01_bin.150]